MRDIILASASPRRRELLEQLGWRFTVCPAQREEVITKKVPAEIVRELSFQKAMEAAGKSPEGCITIGADTMVAVEELIMGKPSDEEEARTMLRRLQGGVHQVYTGVTVVIREGADYEYFTFHERTEVELYPMSETQIREYVSTGEPMDKAGAYAVQGIAARYVRGLRGDYYNVVGLPIARLYQEMYERGLT